MPTIHAGTNRRPAATLGYNMMGMGHVVDTLIGEDVNRAQCTKAVTNFDKGMMMTQIRKQLLIGLTALGLGLGSIGAYAHKAGGDHAGKGPESHEKAGERMKERMEKRQAELHEKLKLDASQQQAWDRYIARMKPAARPDRPNRTEMEKLTAPERMERMQAMMRARDARMSEHVSALKEFYAVLTPEQKKIFDSEFGHGTRRHHHRK